jgi:uncharacterized protein YndB with AHSA1/START domain
MKIHRSIEIQAAPERIWPFLVEPEKIVQWCFTLRSFEYTSKETRGVGATFRYEERGRFRDIGITCAFTEWIEYRQLSFEMTEGNGFKSYIETWLIEPTPNGSRFTFFNQSELPFGLIGRVIEPLSRRRAEGTVDEMLNRLKRLVEKKVSVSEVF